MGEMNGNTTTSATAAPANNGGKVAVTDVMLSSVVPGHVKSTPGREQQEPAVTDRRDLNGIDMAVKLHYLRGVYFFDHEAVTGMTKVDLKHPMFDWLELYRVTCGRIRVDEGTDQLPFIKINDSGVRIVEARCDGMTIEEWLRMDDCCGKSDELLVYDHHLGPDLNFSPLVFIQITWFKCGGISMGLTWAHILGDMLSATAFMNSLGRFLRSDNNPQQQPRPLRLHEQQPKSHQRMTTTTTNHKPQPTSLKQVDSVKTHWTAPVDKRIIITSHTFHFTRQQINRLRSTINNGLNRDQIRSFHLVSAVIWRSILKIRKQDRLPNTITICKHYQTDNRENFTPFNGYVITVTERTNHQHPVSESELTDLVAVMVQAAKDESGDVREFVERERGMDFVMYGANLTFVDMEDADVYGFEVNGRKPVFVNYTIGGVASGGAVVVLPYTKREGEGGGAVVTVMLEDEEIDGLKMELKQVMME